MQSPTTEPDRRTIMTIGAVIAAAALGSLLTIVAMPSAPPPRAANGLAELSARVDVLNDAVAEIRTELNASASRRIGDAGTR